MTLVGHRGVRIAGTDHDTPGCERRPDHRGNVLGAGGVEEQRIGHRVNGLPAVRHQELTDLVPQPGATGLPREQDVVTQIRKGGRKPARLHRLAGTVRPLDGDEAARGPSVCRHPASVAGVRT
ncbi:MAG: hypothetical protein HW391_1344 [Chloroflexi bacterium]|nr:hypothetical protein [Chloroflexota bacterium]